MNHGLLNRTLYAQANDLLQKYDKCTRESEDLVQLYDKRIAYQKASQKGGSLDKLIRKSAKRVFAFLSPTYAQNRNAYKALKTKLDLSMKPSDVTDRDKLKTLRDAVDRACAVASEKVSLKMQEFEALSKNRKSTSRKVTPNKRTKQVRIRSNANVRAFYKNSAISPRHPNAKYANSSEAVTNAVVGKYDMSRSDDHDPEIKEINETIHHYMTRNMLHVVFEDDMQLWYTMRMQCNKLQAACDAYVNKFKFTDHLRMIQEKQAMQVITKNKKALMQAMLDFLQKWDTADNLTKIRHDFGVKLIDELRKSTEALLQKVAQAPPMSQKYRDSDVKADLDVLSAMLYYQIVLAEFDAAMPRKI